MYLDLLIEYYYSLHLYRPATNGDVSRLPASETSISLVYVVEGVTMGMALLLYNATVTTGKVITSWPAEIQVECSLLHVQCTCIQLQICIVL